MSVARKGRSDSVLRSLPPEQRAKVDAWLFEEETSHAEVAKRCREQFGVELAESSVGRYSQQERPRYEARRMAGARNEGKATVRERMMAAEEQYHALLERLNRVALLGAQQLEIEPEPQMVRDLTKVLISARREASLALSTATAREKFEFDAATACLVHCVQVQSIADDESLDDAERVQKIREELFGTNLPE